MLPKLFSAKLWLQEAEDLEISSKLVEILLLLALDTYLRVGRLCSTEEAVLLLTQHPRI